MRERVFVVGGGPSVKTFDLRKLSNEDTIVVNKSFMFTPNPTYFVTMDYTFLKKVNIEQFKRLSCPKFFIVNRAFEKLQEIDGRIVDVRFNLVYDLKDFDVIIKSYKGEGLGFTWDDFRNGANSGFCGVQLAILLGYSEIYLVGFDLMVSGDWTHYHDGYGESKDKFSKKLDFYYEMFLKGLDDLKKVSNPPKLYLATRPSRLESVIEYREV